MGMVLPAPDTFSTEGSVLMLGMVLAMESSSREAVVAQQMQVTAIPFHGEINPTTSTRSYHLYQNSLRVFDCACGTRCEEALDSACSDMEFYTFIAEKDRTLKTLRESVCFRIISRSRHSLSGHVTACGPSVTAWPVTLRGVASHVTAYPVTSQLIWSRHGLSSHVTQLLQSRDQLSLSHPPHAIAPPFLIVWVRDIGDEGQRGQSDLPLGHRRAFEAVRHTCKGYLDGGRSGREQGPVATRA
eukprot:3095761-Rhodomonas_salina.2